MLSSTNDRQQYVNKMMSFRNEFEKSRRGGGGGGGGGGSGGGGGRVNGWGGAALIAANANLTALP